MADGPLEFTDLTVETLSDVFILLPKGVQFLSKRFLKCFPFLLSLVGCLGPELFLFLTKVLAVPLFSFEVSFEGFDELRRLCMVDLCSVELFPSIFKSFSCFDAVCDRLLVLAE